MVMAGVERETCPRCTKFALTTSTIRIEGDLSEFLNDTNKQKAFYRCINGMLNEKGGLLVLHAESTDQLGLFDQKIDSRLQNMIPDGRLYHSVFERFTVPNHIIFRVKPNLNERRLYSTLDFNTKISVNKGKENPSYAQMSVLIQDVSIEQPESAHCQTRAHTMEFQFMKPVKIKKGETMEQFQESMTLQAKACEIEDHSVKKLVRYCWKNAKLNEYISAFTKIPEGGSVYIGVFEEKIKTARWKEVTNDITHIVEVKDVEWKPMVDKKQEVPLIYHIVKEGSAPENELATGKFNCKGVKLPPENHEDFRRSFDTMVEQELLWFGSSSPVNPVCIEFHSVQTQTEEYYVIEVRINYYHGICFHVPDGPECYTSNFEEKGPPYSEPEAVVIDDWITPYLRQNAIQVESDTDTDGESEDGIPTVLFKKQTPVKM